MTIADLFLCSHLHMVTRRDTDTKIRRRRISQVFDLCNSVFAVHRTSHQVHKPRMPVEVDLQAKISKTDFPLPKNNNTYKKNTCVSNYDYDVVKKGALIGCYEINSCASKSGSLCELVDCAVKKTPMLGCDCAGNNTPDVVPENCSVCCCRTDSPPLPLHLVKKN